MGNSCECVSRQTDDAEDALLSPDFENGDQPRGPPPPYQPRAPLYAYAQMTDEQRIQLVQRLTLIQCLPCGRYADAKEEKKSLDLDDTCTGSGHGGEKKGDKDRECPICMLDFVVGQPIRLLPCMHYYHMRCIDDWLMRSLTCPTCMERVDVGVRNTVLSHNTLRRRRVGSSSSTISTVSTASSSSMEQLLNYSDVSPAEGSGRSSGFGHHHGPQLQLRTTSPGQRHRNRNETQQRAHSHSPVHSTGPLTLNLDQVVSPPGSPVAASGGHRGIPPRSPPLIEYHYEYLPTPTRGRKS